MFSAVAMMCNIMNVPFQGLAIVAVATWVGASLARSALVSAPSRRSTSATGCALETRNFSLAVPAGWRISIAGTVAAIVSPDRTDRWTVIAITGVRSPTPTKPTALAKQLRDKLPLRSASPYHRWTTLVVGKVKVPAVELDANVGDSVRRATVTVVAVGDHVLRIVVTRYPKGTRRNVEGILRTIRPGIGPDRVPVHEALGTHRALRLPKTPSWSVQ